MYLQCGHDFLLGALLDGIRLVGISLRKRARLSFYPCPPSLPPHLPLIGRPRARRSLAMLARCDLGLVLERRLERLPNVEGADGRRAGLVGEGDVPRNAFEFARRDQLERDNELDARHGQTDT